MSHGGDHPGRTGLSIEVSAAGEVCVVALTGEIDAASVGGLLGRVDDLAASGSVEHVLDLGGVTFLDSSGLGALVALRRRLEADRGALVLACDNEVVLRLLRLTSLDTVLPVYKTVADALGNGFVG
jgi:anti-sigma B factor antagonist